MPSIHGEDAVLRVLDKQGLYEAQQQLSLTSLGFAPAEVKRLRRLSNEPYGMLLVTGPTGSGKTTTHYAAISEINNGQDKIVTNEDPVEYQLPGVLQIPVNEKKRSEEHTSELQSPVHLVCRLLLEKKKKPTRATRAGPSPTRIWRAQPSRHSPPAGSTSPPSPTASSGAGWDWVRRNFRRPLQL